MAADLTWAALTKAFEGGNFRPSFRRAWIGSLPRSAVAIPDLAWALEWRPYRPRGDYTSGRPPRRGGLLVEELFAVVPEPAHKLLEGRRANDAVELRPIVPDEADVLDGDVVDQPVVALLQHPRLDGDLGALLGDDLGPHDGEVTV